ncbi:hypothetical protein JZ751_018904 [Albula glossodonta]|uniref:Uncharacterized protein n=1 Tax=Albula glossodonta TaxID=121402 RepID=A0A8T2MZH0_9TELE|nr:hypothetical protein JZ751_018904 [Albula glossodonta]
MRLGCPEAVTDDDTFTSPRPGYSNIAAVGQSGYPVSAVTPAATPLTKEGNKHQSSRRETETQFVTAATDGREKGIEGHLGK